MITVKLFAPSTFILMSLTLHFLVIYLIGNSAIIKQFIGRYHRAYYFWSFYTISSEWGKAILVQCLKNPTLLTKTFKTTIPSSSMTLNCPLILHWTFLGCHLLKISIRYFIFHLLLKQLPWRWVFCVIFANIFLLPGAKCSLIFSFI